MKVTSIVILSLACVAAVLAFPAKPEGNDETELVSVESELGGQPIVDTGVITGGSPFFSSPFDGLFESLAGMMTRMRQQMEYLLNRIPTVNGTEEALDPGFPGSQGFPGFGTASFPQFGDLDLGKGNTTSVTKVIDGHKVVINETEYKQESKFGGALFKVRIIDVKPDSEEGAAGSSEKDAEAVTSSSKKDIESVENTFDNEIPKSQDKDSQRYENMETFDDFDQVDGASQKWDNVEPLESFDGNSVELQNRYPAPDLSRDTYVNQILAEEGAPINPDAEVFSVEPRVVPFMTSRGQPFEKIIEPR